MSMRVNQNIPALQSYQSVRQANRATASSMLKLSSGFKINSAKDDAAGVAISNKMRMQINGLEMASQNATNGISLVQSADGALAEVHNMIQRMRELAVKAASDTMEDVDRAKVQEEINALLKEIDDTSERTEFNNIKLFGNKAAGAGGFDFFDPVSKAALSVLKGVSADENFPDGNFSFTVTNTGTPAWAQINISAVPNLGGHTFSIGSKTIMFEDGETQLSALGKISDMAREMGYEVRTVGGLLTIYSQEPLSFNYGASGNITPGASSAGSPASIAAGATFTLPDGTNVPIQSVDYQNNQITFTLGHPYLGRQATVQVDLIIDAGGNFFLNDGAPLTSVPSNGAIAAITLDSTYRDNSKIILQIGSNKDMEMAISIPQVNTKTLGLTELSYLPRLESEESIAKCEKALAEVSRVRSRLGAYQNRLEHAVTSIDITSENTSKALSRILDTDMAKEMTELTTQNLISQAAISILAQANQRPQQVLQLMGN